MVVGLIEKPEHITTQWFKDEGDAIILLGEIADTNDPLLGLGGSAYLQAVQGKKTGTPPRCDLETAKTLHTTLLGLIQSGLVKSAHDCSEGGLAVCLAESCISQLVARETPRLIGATVDLSSVGQRLVEPINKRTAAQSGRRALPFGRLAVWRNAIARGHHLPAVRCGEGHRTREVDGRSGGSNRQSRR